MRQTMLQITIKGIKKQWHKPEGIKKAYKYFHTKFLRRLSSLQITGFTKVRLLNLLNCQGQTNTKIKLQCTLKKFVVDVIILSSIPGNI